MLCRTPKWKPFIFRNKYRIFKTFQLSDNLIYNSLSNYNINELKQLRNENPFRKTIGHININLVRNKFESLVDLVSPNLDVLMTSETKIDERFPWRDFFISLIRKRRDSSQMHQRNYSQWLVWRSFHGTKLEE